MSKKDGVVSQLSRGAGLVKVVINAAEMVGGNEDLVFLNLFKADPLFLGDVGRIVLKQARVAYYPAPSEFLCPDRIPEGFMVYVDAAPTGHDIKDLWSVHPNCLMPEKGPIEGWAFIGKARDLGSKYGLVDADRWLKEGQLPTEPIAWCRSIVLTGTVLVEKGTGEVFIPVLYYDNQPSCVHEHGWRIRVKRNQDVYCEPWDESDEVLVRLNKIPRVDEILMCSSDASQG